MSASLSLDPPPRMRGRLMAMVHSQTGLVEGEVRWIDATQLCLLSPERFTARTRVEARVDLGRLDGHVDVDVFIEEIGPARLRGRYVHGARWSVADPDEERRLVKVGRVLNPRATWAAPVRSRPSPPGPQPGPQLRRAKGLAIQLSATRPPGLLLALDDAAALARVLFLDSGGLRLTVPRVGGLSVDQRVHVALQLPGGLFVDLDARVESVGRHRTVLTCASAPADTRMVLHDLLAAA